MMEHIGGRRRSNLWVLSNLEDVFVRLYSNSDKPTLWQKFDAATRSLMPVHSHRMFFMR